MTITFGAAFESANEKATPWTIATHKFSTGDAGSSRPGKMPSHEEVSILRDDSRLTTAGIDSYGVGQNMDHLSLRLTIKHSIKVDAAQSARVIKNYLQDALSLE